MNYYNENNPKAAAWLRELVKHGLIADGIVDERSIVDVQSGDLTQYRQCHFFAGIGGWPYALRLANWPDDHPVWTCSCPCQPFSCAGKQKGHADERHLWPDFYRLIAECRPATVFGEQVASKLGREWLAGVRADMEGMGYAVGAADLCAAGVGAPHIRQRLFWVADTKYERHGAERDGAPGRGESSGGRNTGRLADMHDTGLQIGGEDQQQADQAASAVSCGALGGMDNTAGTRCDGALPQPEGNSRDETRMRVPCAGSDSGRLGNSASGRNWPLPNGGGLEESAGRGRECGFGGSGAWSGFDLIPCRDGKTRRVESGTFPLAHGIPGRVGLLRGYGNAIVPQLAATFIQAFCEC